MKKKCKVVMLPTDEKANVYLRRDGELRFQDWNKKDTINFPEIKQGQHLYILSDDEIKYGDWIMFKSDYKGQEEIGKALMIGNELCIQIQNTKKSGSLTFPYPRNFTNDVKKIIATTDQSLKLDCYQLPDFTTQCSLPKPSNEFIKEFCKKGGIDEVMVEYEEILPFNENLDINQK